MNIQNYRIEIGKTPLSERLELVKVLEDNGQVIYKNSNISNENLLDMMLVYHETDNDWYITSTVGVTITLKAFIKKFKKQKFKYFI